MPRRTPAELTAPDSTRAAHRRPPTGLPTQRTAVWRDLERAHTSAAPAATRSAPQPPTRPSATYTSPDGSEWSWDGGQWRPLLPAPVRVVWWRSRSAVSIAALLAVIAGSAALVGAYGRGGDATEADSAAIHSALQAAAVAQASHYAETLDYARSIDELIPSGFVPDPEVTVTVVSATELEYCLAGGPADGAPTTWLTQDGSTAPCG